MSAQLRPVASGSGVVSELAFARAQRNTVLIVDDLFSSRLLLEATCKGGNLRAELWGEGQLLEDVALECGGRVTIRTTPDKVYLLRIQAGGEFSHVQYVLKLTVVE